MRKLTLSFFLLFVLHVLQKNEQETEMKQEIILDKPRSIRFTKEQEQVFDELEKSGINISFLIRKVADVVIKEQQTNNQPKQAI